MTMHRRYFLYGAAAGLGALAVPKVSRAAPNGPRFLLIVFAQGAWDVTYCLDPKRAPACDVPTGAVKTYPGGVRVLTSPERPGIDAFFAANAGRCAVVNGLSVNSVAHASAKIRVLTGTRSERNPDIGAIFAATTSETRPQLAMPYVDLGGGAFAGPLASVMGRVGNTNQLVTLLDRSRAFRRGDQPGSRYAPDIDERAALDQFIARRAAAAPGSAALAGYHSSRPRAEALRQDPRLRAMTVGRITSLAQQGALAVELFKSGVSCAAFLDTRLDWDTHDDIADQGPSHERLFSELTQISAQLAAAGLLERTTVAVLSEFSRTPRLNDQPSPGKDHWPVTSALLMGGGVRPGTYGHTDDGLGAQPIRLDDGAASDRGTLLQFDNFAAGLLEFMGVSSRRWIPTTEPFHGPFA